MTTLLIDLPSGVRRRIEEYEVVRFGRDPRLELPLATADERTMSRHVGTFRFRGDDWWLERPETGRPARSGPLEVMAIDGSSRWSIPPGGASVLRGAGAVTFPPRHFTLRFRVEGAQTTGTPDGDEDDGSTTVPVVSLTPRQVDYLVALAEPELRHTPSARRRQLDEIAALWGVRREAVEAALRMLRTRLVDADMLDSEANGQVGVSDLVARIAVSHGLVTEADLAWADLYRAPAPTGRPGAALHPERTGVSQDPGRDGAGGPPANNGRYEPIVPQAPPTEVMRPTEDDTFDPYAPPAPPTEVMRPPPPAPPTEVLRPDDGAAPTPTEVVPPPDPPAASTPTEVAPLPEPPAASTPTEVAPLPEPPAASTPTEVAPLPEPPAASTPTEVVPLPDPPAPAPPPAGTARAGVPPPPPIDVARLTSRSARPTEVSPPGGTGPAATSTGTEAGRLSSRSVRPTEVSPPPGPPPPPVPAPAPPSGSTEVIRPAAAPAPGPPAASAPEARGATAAGTPPSTTAPPPTDPAGTAGDGDNRGPSRRGLLTTGGQWGRWTLRSRIRTGGFAQVWRATDPDGERAALKFLLRPDADVEARRFRRERDLGQRFQGKWLPRVLDADLDDIMPWIAFEYLNFPALDQLVTASGPLSGEALVIFTRDLWDAVLSLHEHSVAHRDLSARNVLIDVDDGRLRLIDLGSGTTGEGTMLTADVFPASMGFAAPEQFDVRESRVGPAADLWSWAAVSFFAATGRTIFPIEPRLAYYDHVRNGRIPDLADVPEPLRPALAAAFRHDPAQRRADEVASLLPLRAHEAALRAAEERLAQADAETMKLRAAVAEANRRLEAHDDDTRRMDVLEVQAAQAAAEAAQARRYLEESSISTRQATAATARVTELRDELNRAVHRRSGTQESSDATIRGLTERLRQADEELARLRQQLARNQALPTPAPRPPPQPQQPQQPPPQRRPQPQPQPQQQPRWSPPRGQQWSPPPGQVAPPQDPRAPGRRPPAVPPGPPPAKRRGAGAKLLDAFMILAVTSALYLAVAFHPGLARSGTDLRKVTHRSLVAAGVTASTFIISLFTSSVGRRPVARGLWIHLLVIGGLLVAYAYRDPTGTARDVIRWLNVNVP